jgi:hypothetical protein
MLHQWKRCMSGQLIVLLTGVSECSITCQKVISLEARLLHLEIGELVTAKRHELERYQSIERR